MGKLVTAVLWWIAIHHHQTYSSYFGKLCLVQLSRLQNNLMTGKYGYNTTSVQKRRKRQHWLYFASTKLLLLAPSCNSFTRITEELVEKSSQHYGYCPCIPTILAETPEVPTQNQDQEKGRRYLRSNSFVISQSSGLISRSIPLLLQLKFRTPLKQRPLSYSNIKHGCREQKTLQIIKQWPVPGTCFVLFSYEKTHQARELCNLQLLSCRLALTENIHSRDFPRCLTLQKQSPGIQKNGRRDWSQVSKWGGKATN